MVVSLSAGPVALWLAVLNARDRRRDRLAILVRRVCETQPLRGRVAMTIRAPLLSRRIAVVLDMSECDAEEVWSTACRLADVLPYHVVLAIATRLDGAVPVAVVLGRPPTRVPPRLIAASSPLTKTTIATAASQSSPGSPRASACLQQHHEHRVRDLRSHPGVKA